MPLDPGTTLGPYAVTAKIGEGGMGEVYRARDTKLDRDVALKVLPQAFTDDPDRLARFEREAKVLASLNHPNIGGIHGLEESEGVRALVLEYIEGPTLADRIKQGAIPVDEALPIAKQIAEALEAAHEAGVIHRDLKPANIKVRDDGTVKVLDFGLAKALDSTPEGDPSQSPTLTAAATQMGVIMGTGAYMSPEQARGKPVDKRADIWAFGAVFYEMLTGQRAFGGEDVSDTLAAVLRDDVSLDALPSETPARLRQVLTTCLQREPKHRIHDMADVRLAIEGAFETTVGSSDAAAVVQVAWWQRPVSLIGIAGVVALAVGLLAWIVMSPSPLRIARFSIAPLEDVLTASSTHDLAFSPDGLHAVYRGRDALYVRRLDQVTPVAIPGTQLGYSPFFSPDGEWVGFQDNSTGVASLAKVPLDGGAIVQIMELPGQEFLLLGASWADDDTIVFAASEPSGGLWRVPASGGERESVTAAKDTAPFHLWPHVLPGGRACLFTMLNNALGTGQIAVVDLDTGEQTVLIEEGTSPRYLPTGHLVYATTNGSLHAVSFDTDSLRVTGTAVPVLDNVLTKRMGVADFAVGDDGSLLYVEGAGRGAEYGQLVWVDLQGSIEPLPFLPSSYSSPRLSPDGSRAVVVQRGEDGNIDLHVLDLASGYPSRLTFHPESDGWPLWTPDGQHIVFQSQRDGGGVFRKAANGSGQVERLSDKTVAPSSWSRDGQLVFMWSEDRHLLKADVGTLDLESGDDRMLLENETSELLPAVSPNGRWIVYVGDETGAFRVHARSFPDLTADGPWQLSDGIASSPTWAPDGSAVYYRGPAQGESGFWMMRVPVTAEPVFRPGTPERLFDVSRFVPVQPGSGRRYDPHPDGERFLMIQQVDTVESAGLVLVQNWFEELKARVPTE